MCCFHCLKNEKMTNGKRSFIPILDTWMELEESSIFFYWASLFELDLEFVSFLPLELDSSTSVISSMVEKIPWSGNEKTHYRSTPIHFIKSKWFPWITKFYNVTLKSSSKNLAKLPTNCFDHLFSFTTSVGIILQPSEHDMLLWYDHPHNPPWFWVGLMSCIC